MSTTIDFPKDKSITIPYSILALETVGFSQQLRQPRVQVSTREMTNLNFISLEHIDLTERNISTNSKFVTSYLCNTSHEKTAPLAEKC